MEPLAIVVLPILVLAVGLALVHGRPVTPGAVLPRVFALSWRVVRGLWTERPRKSGAGRVKRPPIRYRR